MADRDCASVDVDSLLVEAQLSDDDKALRRERFVQLHEIQLVHRHAGTGEQLAHGGNRTNAHDARIDPRGPTGDEAFERIDTHFEWLLLPPGSERRRNVG